ncbi:hypothetical protein [Argonema galeatum]|uniref:hypothetical protein n=1 Tax=Argonema galeatum TaxID=2942762 RepID=UPI002011E858|nr:hypothetical protein [Argonema galeatum]MCL1465950.1 hypothetical protein [Argonema galeatum A003/A1]
MSYSSEQSIPSQHNNVDSNLSRRISYNLSGRDQCDLVALEYIAQDTDSVGRGVTVVEMMSVMDLSNPATSSRLRRMSDIEYGRIDAPLLERRKCGAPQGADSYFLAEGVSLAEIQKIMAKKGYSYERYHAKRQGKKQANNDNEYESTAGNDLENELTDDESDQTDSQFSENGENQEESNSSEPNEIYECSAKQIDDSDGDNKDAKVEVAAMFRLAEVVIELKQNYTAIKEENVLLKQEIDNLKSRLAKLEEKLLSGSSSRLMAMLDEAFAPNQAQNGKAGH